MKAKNSPEINNLLIETTLRGEIEKLKSTGALSQRQSPTYFIDMIYNLDQI
jgi:hypothetical protein